MKRTAAVILAGALLGAGFVAAGGAAEQGEELFEKKCGMCHPLSRTLSQNQDRDGWTKTVTRMREVNGSPITDKEAKAIVDYLAKARGAEAK